MQIHLEIWFIYAFSNKIITFWKNHRPTPDVNNVNSRGFCSWKIAMTEFMLIFTEALESSANTFSHSLNHNSQWKSMTESQKASPLSPFIFECKINFHLDTNTHTSTTNYHAPVKLTDRHWYDINYSVVLMKHLS